MKRRTLLKSVACGTAIGFAGCLNQADTDASGENGTDSESGSNTDAGNNGTTDTDSANNDDSSGETDDNTDDGTTDNTETETGSANETTDSDGGDGNDTPRSPKQKPALVDHSFEIVSAGCGTKRGAINTSVTDHTVHVTGTIRGKNSCYTAELKNVTFEQGTLTVTVRSFETGSNMCAMCLKNIEYESTYTFEGQVPERVVVIHNGKQVLKTKR